MGFKLAFTIREIFVGLNRDPRRIFKARTEDWQKSRNNLWLIFSMQKKQ
jgi:hypothetical protein